MIRRVLSVCLVVLALGAGRAEAVTIRDIIELSKAGLGDSVLLALIEVDHSIFAVDAASVRQLKDAGVSDAVIVAMIRSGRQTPTPPPPPAPVAMADPPAAPEPQVIVIDHHDNAQQQAQVYQVPVAVPVFVPVVTAPVFNNALRNSNVVKATVSTDQGLVRARLPLPLNCVNAQPVFWGFGGKLRPGSWAPPPTVLCQ